MHGTNSPIEKGGWSKIIFNTYALGANQIVVKQDLELFHNTCFWYLRFIAGFGKVLKHLQPIRKA